VDGATTITTTFCCNALHLALNGGASELICVNEGLWGKEQDNFLQRTAPEFIADTCLVALTLISYLLPKRRDLIPYFEKTLTLNASKLIERTILTESE